MHLRDVEEWVSKSPSRSSKAQTLHLSMLRGNEPLGPHPCPFEKHNHARLPPARRGCCAQIQQILVSGGARKDHHIA